LFAELWYMRVLFTHSYFLRFDPKQWKQMQPYAPLGTICAAALLREKGFSVALHDVMFSTGPATIEDALITCKPDLLVIYDDGFNYLTKMCLTNMREAAFEMCRLAKNHGCKVIVCSSDATDNFDKYLGHEADYVITGEGEQTLLELVTAIKDGSNDYLAIDGLVFRNAAGATIRTHPRKLMHDLDALPLPAWDLVDMDRYKKAWMASSGYWSVNISTTRGCPFKCNWCAKPIYGNRYNVRSPEHVINELLLLKEKFGLEHVWFCDDIFGLSPGWIKRFSELVVTNDLHFRFKIQSRADLLLKDAQVAPLAAAGCEIVWMGAESGSQKILDAMDKGITTEQIKEATQQLRKHGIKVAYFLQFGYLGETKEDIDKTLLMLRHNQPDDIGISVSYPLPGTKFFDMVGHQLRHKTNWTDSNDLALMFRNTFDTAYYRRLHKYVHAYFRKQKSVSGAGFSLRQIARIPWYTVMERWYRRYLEKPASRL
jgi:anaerobic magnesium-protoporphyrin IX monomethyl ester cyclase